MDAFPSIDRLKATLDQHRPPDTGIVPILDPADQELTFLRNQRSAIEQQKRVLMRRQLTGKVRVAV